MKDGINIKTSMATINIDLVANDEQTLNMLRDSLIGWYEGFCTGCLDNGVSCETTFSREETNKTEVKQVLNGIYGAQYVDTDSIKVSAPVETVKTRKHVYDMFKHFKAVTTTECKECDECAEAAANYCLNLEQNIKDLEREVKDLKESFSLAKTGLLIHKHNLDDHWKEINCTKADVETLMKDIIHILNFLSSDEEYLKYVEDCEAEKFREMERDSN